MSSRSPRQAFTVEGSVDTDIFVMGNRNRIGRDPRRPANRASRDAKEEQPPVLAIVTALPEEFAAMRVLLDDPRAPQWVSDDGVTYIVGTLPGRSPQPHRVVLTMLGETGNAAAAASCTDLIRSFRAVSLVVMVGTACGIPNVQDAQRHVRLGDIVVATRGVVDYDHVVEADAGRELRRPFPRPSPLLVRGAKLLQAAEIAGDRPWERWLERAQQALPQYRRPPDRSDVLYATDDPERRIPQPPADASGHRPGWPKVHYGTVGSADRSFRSGGIRDDIARAHNLCAIEMEIGGIGSASFAAGLEWFVVRGISDYGDRHTTHGWRGYAALAAAAYTRALIAECPLLERRGGRTDPVGE